MSKKTKAKLKQFKRLKKVVKQLIELAVPHLDKDLLAKFQKVEKYTVPAHLLGELGEFVTPPNPIDSLLNVDN